MTPHQLPDSRYLIPIAMFDTCVLDGMTRSDISEAYTRDMVTCRRSVYYLEKFAHHLREKHGGLSLKDYCVIHLKVEWPKCPGTGKEVGWRINGKGIVISRYARGGVTKKTHTGFADHCKVMSEERKGEGNPMHGKESWNKGLTASTDERVAAIAESLVGRIKSPETIEKHRQQLIGRPSKTKGKRIHSDERREWFRGHTARLWQRGVFNKVSSIHVKMREFLSSLPLKEPFTEELAIGPFSVDFAFPLAKVVVEADGDYYHVNPEFYPNGPENAMQRRNHGRDKAKDKYLAVCGWTVIRAWEHDINSGAFKDPLTCKLKQSGLLDA